jgi:uncharacterized RDD family membrane protein YckC
MTPLEGVYFRREDYAAFGRRALVDIVDFVIAAGAWFVLMMVIGIAFNIVAGMPALTVITGGIIWFGYFIVLKRVARTPGYMLGRVRLIGVDGLPAGWDALFTRALFICLGPLNWLMDLATLWHDRHRQTVRDKFARTYVVKKDAKPIGKGKLVVKHFSMSFINLVVREVQVEEPSVIT